jgi:hypothetical protein
MRGGPGAQPGRLRETVAWKNTTRWPLNLQSLLQCGTRPPAPPRGRAGPRGPRHENFRKFAGRQIKFEYGRIFWVDSRVSTQKVCPYTNFGIWSARHQDLKKLARHEFQSLEVSSVRLGPVFCTATTVEPADSAMYYGRSRSPSRRRDVRRSQYAYGATSWYHLEWRKYILYDIILLGTSNK